MEDALLVGGGCREWGWLEGPVGRCPVPGVPFLGQTSPTTRRAPLRQSCLRL